MLARTIILGKPNVGKSSIFNVILKKKIAIVDDFSGLTRDLRKKTIKLWDKKCEMVDTPGLFNSEDKLEKNILNSTIDYAKLANIIILVFDGKAELTIDDHKIIKIVRKLNKKVILVINKTEGKINQNLCETVNNLGLGQANNISATHNQSIDQLKWKLYKMIDDKDNSFEEKVEDVSVAIVGKTNTGKSTIFNLINKKKIALTGSLPHLTRDSIEAYSNLRDLNIKIFDTAGFSNNNSEKVNKLSIEQTLKKIRLCKFILIILDINNYFEKINSKIISLVYSENRCYVVLVNKIDSVKDFSRRKITDHLYNLNPQIKESPILFVSAKDEKGFKDLDTVIKDQLSSWNTRIKTNELNRWLTKVVKENPPPLKNGNIVKLKYIVQVSVSPPKFNIFSNFPNSLNNQYKRYVSNKLKRNFNLKGMPIKILFKKTSNPYEKN